MQAEFRGYEGSRKVLGFHVYTFDPRRPTCHGQGKADWREHVDAAGDLRKWRKTYRVTVNKRSVGSEKAKADLWCVTLTEKGSE